MSISVVTESIERIGDLAGVVDSKKGTVSFWTKPAAAMAGSSRYIFAIGDTAGDRGFQITKGATNVWTIQGRNSAGTLILNMLGKTAATVAWQHTVASWDLSAAKGKIFLNGVDDTAAGATLTDGTIDYTQVNVSLFDAVAPAILGQFVGGVYDFAFWPGTYVDLTVAAELAKFISSDGLVDFANPGPTAGTRKPVAYHPDLGRPAVFFTGAFTHNMGNGGSFASVVAGAPAEASDEPAAYRQSGSPAARPGERSFDSDKSGFTYPRSQTFIERREGNPDFGLRMGLDERSAPTRDDNPGYRLSRWIFQDREEDDEEYDR